MPKLDLVILNQIAARVKSVANYVVSILNVPENVENIVSRAPSHALGLANIKVSFLILYL